MTPTNPRMMMNGGLSAVQKANRRGMTMPGANGAQRTMTPKATTNPAAAALQAPPAAMQAPATPAQPQVAPATPATPPIVQPPSQAAALQRAREDSMRRAMAGVAGGPLPPAMTPPSAPPVQATPATPAAPAAPAAPAMQPATPAAPAAAAPQMPPEVQAQYDALMADLRSVGGAVTPERVAQTLMMTRGRRG